MSKNYMPEVAKMLGVEIGEEFDMIVGKALSGPFRFTEFDVVDREGWSIPLDRFHKLLVGEHAIKKRPWRPKEGERYWYCSAQDGCVYWAIFCTGMTRNLAFLNMGNCFPTEEAALAAKPEMLEKFEEIKEGSAGVMDVIKYFNTKKRMCEFHKGTCHLCPMGKDNTKTHLLCFELQQEKPEIADAIVEQWAKEHPVKTYKSVFLEKFPDAAKEDGVPVTCVVAVFGEKKKPEGCYNSITCSDCWNREVEE